MEVKKKLVMSFMTALGISVSISVDDPRENITEADIKSCIDLIVSKVHSLMIVTLKNILKLFLV
ncbi:MAG: DUF2922 domain-containing protein [Paraclostridium sordellii]|uniref:DUF2922 domain-containing protein n=1 Tax=Paraclostridium sordellii TaxID=1505 RepID=UPI00214A5972|nr:DUF2922 domain-containing protein [Paeniclostridium sordellii]MCR1849165.1 DUF2922 domain-containing protein [Paeniclostridium sordellii]